jgi:hypothetical protein
LAPWGTMSKRLIKKHNINNATVQG